MVLLSGGLSLEGSTDDNRKIGAIGNGVRVPHLVFTSDFLDPENIGGSGRVILEVGSRLASLGHRVSILAGAHESSRWIHQYNGAALEWMSFPYPIAEARRLSSWMTYFQRLRAARASLDRPDLFVHNQPLTSWCLGKCATPSAYVYHSPWSLEYLVAAEGASSDALGPSTLRGAVAAGVRNRLEAGVVRRARRVFTLSNTMKAHAIALHGIRPDLVEVRPGSADLDRFSPLAEERRQQVRSRLGVAPGEILLVCVRRLIPRTGVDLLIAALELVVARRPRVKVIVAGRGQLQDVLFARGRRLSDTGCLRFAGYVPEEDLAGLYGAADAAVMPTRALEGFGLSTLEALACGTPVLATPVGGSVEILGGLDSRLLASEVSATALADLLLEWTAEPERLGSLRSRCRAHAGRGFDWQNLASGVAELASESAPTRPRARLAVGS